MISREIFTVYHCKACNKIEVSQYITKEQMEELGLTEEDLKPICPFTGSSDLEELGQLAENELRHFAYTDVEGVKRYLKEKEKIENKFLYIQSKTLLNRELACPRASFFCKKEIYTND